LLQTTARIGSSCPLALPPLPDATYAPPANSGRGEHVRGYFGIGVEQLSKAGNVGALWRTAHGFGAAFLFTLGTRYAAWEGGQVDTSRAEAQLPLYHFADVDELRLPRHCQLIGVETTEDATLLPSFRHPRAAAYVFGRERLSLSPELVARCDHVVRIPSRFALNVAVAGAIVMYDRLISLGRFAARPVGSGGPTEPLPEPMFGAPKFRRPPD
jgi:tRNA G18 (ribose-2'-O)-methylase SpoU